MIYILKEKPLLYICFIMQEHNTILYILFSFSVLLVFVVIVAIIIMKIRKYGGSISSTTMYGTTDMFYDKDKRRGIEMVVEQKANKKLEEQKSAEGEKV
jgi:hypothetical protein